MRDEYGPAETAVVLETASGLQSVKAWHVNVHYHDVWSVLTCRSQGTVAVVPDANVITEGLEEHAKGVCDVVDVIHQENSYSSVHQARVAGVNPLCDQPALRRSVSALLL